MSQHYPVSTQVEGRTYTGTWTLKQGNRMCVCWPMRDVEPRTVDLGPKRPEALAPLVLKEIVEGWLAANRPKPAPKRRKARV